jgi:hypothetical protein
MKKHRTQLEEDVEVVRRFLRPLRASGYRGRAEDLWQALGLDYSRFWAAVNWTRSAEHMEAKGWTIPYLKGGHGPKVWRVVSTAAGQQFIEEGRQARIPEIVETIRRLHAQLNFSTGLDPTTVLGQRHKTFASLMVSLVDVGEMILDMDGIDALPVTSERRPRSRVTA